jgi:hypothetical protein
MGHARRRSGVVIMLLFGMVAANAAAESPQVIDDFSDASRWDVVAAEGVELKTRAERAGGEDAHGTALRLDFHFVSGGGFAGIRRSLPLNLPENFEVAFSLRGDLPRNNLELKLIDDAGQSVWWVNRRRFEFPRKWSRLASRRRHFQFAWGPSNAPIKRLSAIEIVVASAEGGRGTLHLDDLTFRALPATKPYSGTPIVMASSRADAGADAQKACDGSARTAWTSAPPDESPQLTVDFRVLREFGGLVLHWDPELTPMRYEVQLSDDGQNWSTARAVESRSATPQFISLPDAEASSVRLTMAAQTNKQVALREIEVLPLEASRDPNAFAAVVAGRAPRGHYPRAQLGEGTFWTVVGPDGDDREALVSDDGAVEVGAASFTIEPFLLVDGRLLTWADANCTQSLAGGHAPVPTVVRDHEALRLSVTAAADGPASHPTLLLLYTVSNQSSKSVRGDLLLTARPFQVNPPYQWLNTMGGVAPIDRIALSVSQRAIEVNDREIGLGAMPDDFGAATFDEGDVTSFLIRGQTPPRRSVADPQRAASAAARYGFDLAPNASRSWALTIPFDTNKRARAAALRPFFAAADPVEKVRQRQAAVAATWADATSTVDLLVPDEAADIVDTIRATLAYILVNRDGAGIQPGSRSYERSWIRDGSLTAAALLRFGLERQAREFVDWYAPYQFDSGKVPCVVDRRGPDPVPENDSHGQLIMAVMNVYRFTGDEDFLRKHWPRVAQAVRYIEKIRGERMTADYADANTTKTRQEPGKAAVSLHAFFGLVPESISHEGYSAKPMHSYWDDFFTLRGLKDAAEMARILGKTKEAKRNQLLADDFAKTLYASIESAMRTHEIDYIPGCVELGDFDATSTTIALWPCGELERLPRPALDRTFQRYWEQFVARRDDPSFAWTAYTPYELRCVGTFVLLGQRDRAHEALEFFMNDRRPPGWRQWPEVVHRQARAPQFIGDLPHTWCGSDFLNSVRMMFLHERESDDSLLLLAGIPNTWISARPVGFKNMPTYGGSVSCVVQRRGDNSGEAIAHISGDLPVPRGGIRVTLPLERPTSATVDGKAAEIDADGRVIVRQLPATVRFEAAASAP